MKNIKQSEKKKQEYVFIIKMKIEKNAFKPNCP